MEFEGNERCSPQRFCSLLEWMIGSWGFGSSSGEAAEKKDRDKRNVDKEAIKNVYYVQRICRGLTSSDALDRYT